MESYKVSVIIPVYNVEEYISECIISLLKQDFIDVEFIFINDGSLDKSMEILEKYTDKRIKIINQKNAGLSAARNIGIKYSSGQYILFLDSDDYLIKNDAIKDMYKLAEKNNSDIVVGNAVKIYISGEKVSFYRDKNIFYEHNLNSIEFLKQFINKDSMQSPVVMNLYNRRFLIENSLFFKEGILHEDELFTPQVFLKANNISIYPYEFYGYRQREGSIMYCESNRDKRNKDIMIICNELINIINEIEDKELKKALNKKVKYLILNTINNSNKIKISFKLRKFLFLNSEGLKQYIINIILMSNIKIYKRLLIITKKI